MCEDKEHEDFEDYYFYSGQGEVELKPACFYICDECGRKNFLTVAYAVAEITKEDMEAYGPDLRYAEDTILPSSVQCSNCESEYLVRRV